jgi:hypothetical protein
MGEFNALRAVGMLVRFGSEPGFLGSCFAFREARSVLTAAHCLDGLAPDDVRVWLADRGYSPGVEVIRHPSADVAIVKPAPDDAAGIDPFRRTFGRGLPLGDDCGELEAGVSPRHGGTAPRARGRPVILARLDEPPDAHEPVMYGRISLLACEATRGAPC